MELQKWTEILKEKKTAYCHTGGNYLQVTTNPEHTRWELNEKHEHKLCKCCKSDISKTPEGKPVIIEFFNRVEHLTIFQAYMLYMILKKNQRPLDYGTYHNCQAGKEFIQNIKLINIDDKPIY